MSVRKHRKFKLGFPLKFKRVGSELVIIDKFSNDYSLRLEELDTFEIKSIDSDGFVLFEVSYSKFPKSADISVHLSSQAEAGINGYTLFHSSVARSTSYGHVRSNFEYYKRKRDLSYYALIKREGTKPPKIILGSMFDGNSRIGQMMRIIHTNIRDEWFDRKMLSKYLPSPLNNNRLMKCIFDILTIEDLLFKKEAPSSGRKGRKREMFKMNSTMIKFMVDPKSFQKTNGLNVSQLALTSDNQ